MTICKKNKTFNNTLYCIKYIWKIDAKYILLMVVISVLTSIFNVINLSILRYITETLMKRATAYFPWGNRSYVSFYLLLLQLSMEV